MTDSQASAVTGETRARIAAEARTAAAISAREALERELLEAVRARAEVEARVQIAVEGRKRAEAYAADQGRRLGETEAELQRLRALVQELLPLVEGHPQAPGALTSEAPPSGGGRGAAEHRERRLDKQERQERRADARRTRELLAQAKRTRALIAYAQREERKRGGAGSATAPGSARGARPAPQNGAPAARPPARAARRRVPLAVHMVGIVTLLVAGGLFFVPWGASNADEAGARLDQAGGVMDEQGFDYSLIDMHRLEQAMGEDRPDDSERLGEWLAATPEAARRQLEAVGPEALGEVLSEASSVVAQGEVTAFEGRFDERRLTDSFGDPDDGPWLGAQGALPFALQRCSGGLCMWHGVAEQPAQLVEPAVLLSEDDSAKRLFAGLDATEPYLAQLHRSQTVGSELERLAGDGMPGIVTAGYSLAQSATESTLLLGLDHESDGAAQKNAPRLETAVEQLLAQARLEGEVEAEIGVEVNGTLVIARVETSSAIAPQTLVEAFVGLVK